MIKRDTSTLTKRAGVTILEILIALAIIALIAAVVGPRLISYLGRAKSETAGLQLKQIKSAMQLYYIDMGRYPSDAEGLAALVSSPAGNGDWQGPYLENESGLKDPWGRDYIFHAGSDGALPEILTFGRDGVQGGTGEDADVRP